MEHDKKQGAAAGGSKADKENREQSANHYLRTAITCSADDFCPSDFGRSRSLRVLLVDVRHLKAFDSARQLVSLLVCFEIQFVMTDPPLVSA